MMPHWIMLYALSIDANLKAIAEETGGDLKKENRLTKMCEEFGFASKLDLGKVEEGYAKPYLRTVINDFTYVPPEKLEWGGEGDGIGGESHSLSRVFAWSS